MTRYTLRRIAVAIPVAWGAVTALFLLFFLVPGDPVQQLAGERAVTPTVRAAIEAKYGLDRPWYVRYGRYWGQVLRGDLGRSYEQSRSVNEIVRSTAPASLRLAVWALVLELAIGLAAGVVWASTARSLVDALVAVSTTVLVAVPVFVLGYLFQYVLGVYAFQGGLPAWARFPVQGIGPDRWTLGFLPRGEQWRYLLLPALTVASVHAAIVARITRAGLRELWAAQHVRAAAAKGLTDRQLLLRHGLRNAMIPVVTLVGLDLANLIGSAVLTETVFNWPGMGSALFRAATRLDAPVVLGLALVLVVTHVLVSLLVDLGYGWLDPRIRTER